LMAVRTQPSKPKDKVTLMLQCNEKIIKHKVGLLNLAEELEPTRQGNGGPVTSR